MVWVRIDDSFSQHPKVVKAGPLGMAMQVAALCYCNRLMTDGFVPKQVASGLLNLEGLAMCMWQGEMFGGGEDVTWQLVVQVLVESELWVEVPGGWKIHDYLEYQPSKQDILRVSAIRKEAGRRGGEAKSEQIAKQNGKQIAKQELQQNGKQNPSKTLARTRTRTQSLKEEKKDGGSDEPGASAPLDLRDQESVRRACYQIAKGKKINRPSVPTELTKTGKSWAEIYATLVTAETKADPQSYIAKVINGANSSDQPRRSPNRQKMDLPPA